MMHSYLPFLATLFFFINLFPVRSQDDLKNLYYNCSGATYTRNSTFYKNLSILLDSIPHKSNTTHGFCNDTAGEGINTVNVIALCRGDISQAECFTCLNFSRTDLPDLCPSRIEAIGWYNHCMLRYSSRWIFHTLEEEPSYGWEKVDRAIDHSKILPMSNFSQGLASGLYSSVLEAASGDSHKKYAVRKILFNKKKEIFSLVQCTPDLSELQCTHCLNGSLKEMMPMIANGEGGKHLRPSCSFRYELYRFYEVPTSPSPVTPPSLFPSPPSGINSYPPAGQPNQPNKKIIVIVASSLGSLALFTIVGLLLWLKQRKVKLQSKEHFNFPSNDAHDIKSMESLQYDFETIQVATNNFNSETNKLGQGGFGSVYKGDLVEGKEIAVKRLSAHSGQGDIEFTNEVTLLAKLQHRNLVRLLGYCLKGIERLLIYEFVPNSSLDRFLSDSTETPHLDWDARFKIITGIAKGILYLHEDSRLRVVHRDLKPGNILLDGEMCPKIADFGMARLFSLDQTQGDTTRIVGTYGYMAPEYAMHGRFSVKSDVYSFGIMMLEIISGQKISRFSIGGVPHELTRYAWENWISGTLTNMVDPTILKGSENEILRSMHIGLLCIQDAEFERPTMATVVLMLTSTSQELPLPSKPPIFTGEEPAMTSSSSGGAQASVSKATSLEEEGNSY